MKTLFEKEETPEYEEGLKKLGYKIIAFECFGDWQGDYFAVVEKDNKIGYVIIGYGSCSGCDSLMACNWPSWISETNDEDFQYADKQIRELFSDIEKSIRWGNPSELIRDLLRGNRWSNNIQWYKEDKGFKESRKKLVEALLTRYER